MYIFYRFWYLVIFRYVICISIICYYKYKINEDYVGSFGIGMCRFYDVFLVKDFIFNK